MFLTINFYLFRSISFGIILAVLMFLTLDLLVGFIQQISAVGKGEFTISGAFYYTMLTVPNRIFDNFPVSCVVGVMIGLGALAANSELVVMQSSGISRLKIASVVIMTLLVWLIPMSLMGEFVVPPAKVTAESFRSTKLNKNVGLGVNTGVWIRDGNVIFNAIPIGNDYDRRKNNIVMNDVTVYELNDKLEVVKVSKAQRAEHKGDSWALFHLEVTHFVPNGVVTEVIDQQSWPSRIEPDILSIADTRPKYLSIRDIIKYKAFQEDKAHIPIKYDIALWSKFSYPLLVIATALTGLPFLFGLLRSGGFGQRLLIGVMIGIVLYLVNRTLLNVGEVYHVHPFVVTALPSMVIMVFVLWYLQLKKNS